jgi:hypothetical protein
MSHEAMSGREGPASMSVPGEALGHRHMPNTMLGSLQNASLFLLRETLHNVRLIYFFLCCHIVRPVCFLPFSISAPLVAQSLLGILFLSVARPRVTQLNFILKLLYRFISFPRDTKVCSVPLPPLFVAVQF